VPGADPVAVVSARRGAAASTTAVGSRPKTSAELRPRLERTVIGHRADGTPILGYTTGEGTTAAATSAAAEGGARARARGWSAGAADAGDHHRPHPDVELRRVLLRDAGYLDVPHDRADYRTNATGSAAAPRSSATTGAIADAFYREHGIALGGDGDPVKQSPRAARRRPVPPSDSETTDDRHSDRRPRRHRRADGSTARRPHPTTQQGDPAELGDPGRRALQAERTARTEAERQLREAQSSSRSQAGTHHRARDRNGTLTTQIEDLQREGLRYRVASSRGSRRHTRRRLQVGTRRS
jgi:hypothetical protein